MGPDPLLGVRDLLDAADRKVVVGIRHEPTVEAQQLLQVLGAGWRIDPRAPRCVLRCGRKECRVSDQQAQASRARTMGQFVAPGAAADATAPERGGLTFLVRDELCDGCPWPKVCEGDRTCWKDEREEKAKRRRHVLEAKRQTAALAAMDAGLPQETGPAEEAHESGDSQPPLGGGSAPAGVPGAEVGGASTTKRSWTREAMITALQGHVVRTGYVPAQHDWSGPATAEHPNHQAAYRLFGNWGKFVVAAGYPPPKKGFYFNAQARSFERVAAGAAKTTTRAPREPATPASAPEPVVEPEPEPEPAPPVLVLVDEAPPEPIRETEASAAKPASVSPTGFLSPRVKSALAELLVAIAADLTGEGPDA